jgi:hypothetical protein
MRDVGRDGGDAGIVRVAERMLGVGGESQAQPLGGFLCGGGGGGAGHVLGSLWPVLRCALGGLGFLLSQPVVPQDPAEQGAEARPAHHRHGRHALLHNGDEAAAEHGHRGKVLHDDGRVGHERPELVGLEAGVALEVVEERLLVRVVVGDCVYQQLYYQCIIEVDAHTAVGTTAASCSRLWLCAVHSSCAVYCSSSAHLAQHPRRATAPEAICRRHLRAQDGWDRMPRPKSRGQQPGSTAGMAWKSGWRGGFASDAAAASSRGDNAKRFVR